MVFYITVAFAIVGAPLYALYCIITGYSPHDERYAIFRCAFCGVITLLLGIALAIFFLNHVEIHWK